ncbi:MAG TPA: hypothetical protein VGG39_19890 [Polyangiaceae bacterium]
MTRLQAPALFVPPLCLLCVFCNRTVGGGHVAPVSADGTACNADVECASDHCSGTCQPPASGQVEIDGTCSTGAPCVADATCQDGICVVNATACAALLAPCGADDDCCSGACSTQSQTCTAAGGTCAGEDSACLLDSDCCAGLCDFRAKPTPVQGRCSTACKAHGDACQGGDCCDGYCSALDGIGTCFDCLEPDITEGDSCASDFDCCGAETCVGASAPFSGTCECPPGQDGCGS